MHLANIGDTAFVDHPIAGLVPCVVESTTNHGRAVTARITESRGRFTVGDLVESDYTTIVPAAVVELLPGRRYRIRPYRWHGSMRIGGASSVDTTTQNLPPDAAVAFLGPLQPTCPCCYRVTAWTSADPDRATPELCNRCAGAGGDDDGWGDAGGITSDPSDHGAMWDSRIPG